MPELTIDQIKVKMASLGKILDEARTNKANQSGRLQESMRRSKEDLKLSSIEEAQQEIQTLIAKKEQLTKDLQNKYQVLERNYEW